MTEITTMTTRSSTQGPSRQQAAPLLALPCAIVRRWLLAFVVSTCALLLGCTEYVDQVPGPNPGPPIDHRPLPERPEPLPVAGPEVEVLAEGLASPRGLVMLDQTLYVAEQGAGALVQLELDGALGTLAEELGTPRELATDGSALYTGDVDGGRVLRVELDGQIAVLAQGQTSPTRVAAQDGYLYWVNEGQDGGASWVDAAVRRVPVTGGATEELVALLLRPRALAVDPQYAYFSDGTDAATLWRVPVEGGASEQLAVADGEVAFDMTIDESAAELYWVAYRPPWPSKGWIYRTAVDGSSTVRVVHSSPQVQRVAVDAEHVYWSHVDAINRHPRVGTAAVEPIALKVAVADMLLADGALYFSDVQAGRVCRVLLP